MDRPVNAPPNPAVKIFRVITRAPVFLCLVGLCFADCLLHACLPKFDPASRVALLQRWCRRVLACLRVRFSVLGPVPARGLIVSNHLSYVEILVFSAATRCTFVAKGEIRSWPFIGWIASLTGNVFVDRARPSQTRHPQQEIQDRLQANGLLVLFPEGTTTDSRELLPFRSSLFEAAVAVAAPITAAYVSYELPQGDGDPVMDICYWDNRTLIAHFFNLLTKAEITVTVKFSDQPKIFHDRKQAAREMQREVAELGNALKSSHRMTLA
jgi:lyso-ornithine lipid O-acyltransferase